VSAVVTLDQLAESYLTAVKGTGKRSANQVALSLGGAQGRDRPLADFA
jgi:hypothetical protein